MESIRVDRDEALAVRGEPGEAGGGRMVLVLVALAIVMAGGIWFWWQWHSAESIPDHIAVPPVASAPPIPIAPPQETDEPIRHPVEVTKATEPLPALDESDSAIGAALAVLVGDKPFASLFVPERLVRHIVATVDNLPREEAPVKMWPVRPVGSWLETAGAGDSLTIGPKNAARYAAYVRVVKALDPQMLAAVYRRFYPLFQEAYRDLGYPKGYFNDRLIVAIDDLLATPEPTEPLRLVQAKVRYQFADPDIEHRSAGQKILLRMGPENARVVKAKLRDFRQYVAKAGK